MDTQWLDVCVYACCFMAGCSAFIMICSTACRLVDAVAWLTQAIKDTQTNQATILGEVRAAKDEVGDIFDPAILLPRGSIPAWKRGPQTRGARRGA